MRINTNTHLGFCVITRDMHVTHKLLVINSIVMKINLRNAGAHTNTVYQSNRTCYFGWPVNPANIITDD